MTDAYPLAWPDDWPRTPAGRRKSGSNFARRDYASTIRGLREQLRLMGAEHVVISSNVPIRADGMPYADAARRRIDDPGVAIYFRRRGRPFAMARDAYERPEHNLRSLTLAIEALRQLERHGGGTMLEKAFEGFAALPAPGARRPWRAVLGMSTDLPAATGRRVLMEAEANYRRLAKDAHPDNGGSHERMAELNAAIAEARKELGNG
jgi:hypothetical protein